MVASEYWAPEHTASRAASSHRPYSSWTANTIKSPVQYFRDIVNFYLQCVKSKSQIQTWGQEHAAMGSIVLMWIVSSFSLRYGSAESEFAAFHSGSHHHLDVHRDDDCTQRAEEKHTGITFTLFKLTAALHASWQIRANCLTASTTCSPKVNQHDEYIVFLFSFNSQTLKTAKPASYSFW